MGEIPQHLAIIMDGNGRWAQERGKIRSEGHLAGVKQVREIAVYAAKLGIKCLTLFAFSTENWKRPAEEVKYLMALPKLFFASYLPELMAEDIKLQTIGDLTAIPENTRKIFNVALKKTQNNQGMILNFALNYGSQLEIVQACRRYAAEVAHKQRDNNLTVAEFAAYLQTKDLPPIDLLIRTSGEKRLSNFLLYQLAYSELIFTDVYWPDFTPTELAGCLKEFNARHRRYGGLDENQNN